MIGEEVLLDLVEVVHFLLLVLALAYLTQSGVVSMLVNSVRADGVLIAINAFPFFLSQSRLTFLRRVQFWGS